MDYLFVGGIAFAMAIVAMAAHCFYFPKLIVLDIKPESDNIDTNDQDDDKEHNTTGNPGMKKYILALGITQEDIMRLVISIVAAFIIAGGIALLGYGVTVIAELILERPMPLEAGMKTVIGFALVVGAVFCSNAWFTRATLNYRIRLSRHIEREQAALPRTEWNDDDDAALARLAKQKQEQSK